MNSLEPNLVQALPEIEKVVVQASPISWIPAMVVGVVLYAYMTIFNSVMSRYKESGYTMTWSEFIPTIVPERLIKSFTG
jgi:hypothetical protein